MNDKGCTIPRGIYAVKAKYSDPEVPQYRGNPLIEALPPILKTEQSIRYMSSIPKYDESEKALEGHLRYHCIHQLFQYFQPLRNHIEIEQRISRLIRQGYLARNPVEPEYARSLQEIYEAMKSGDDSFNNCHINTTTTFGFTIIGYSGMGKTTAIEKVLKDYPQIIIHTKYKEQEVNQYQFTWLKLDCPFDGSVKGLCNNFFIEYDRLLGDNSFKKYASGRNTSTNTLIPNMALLARRNSLGVLIIDEVQNLSLAKSGGANKMLNFFVNLINKLGVPVILIGTTKAFKILQSEFRQARRGSGQGDMIWDRLKKDQGEWDLLLEGMWRYQWTRKEIPFTQEIKDVLYDESQGIIDIAVKLFAMSQIRAIAIGKETVTPDLIQTVAKDSLKLVRPMLQALKAGNKQLIAQYDDINLTDIKEYCQQQYNIIQDVEYRSQIKRLQQESFNNTENVCNKALLSLLAIGIEESKAKKCINQIIKSSESEMTASQIAQEAVKIALSIDNSEMKKSKKRTRRVKNLESDHLRYIVNQGRENEQSGYTALKDKGVIKNPVEEFKLIG